MSNAPQEMPAETGKTRPSLLLRIRDRDDDASWREFVRLYGPLVMRCLRRMGVAAHDAADLAQEVMATVARRMPTFDYDPARGSFRGWLLTVTANRARRHFGTQARRPRPRGGTSNVAAVEQIPAPEEDIGQVWEQEWRKRCFQMAIAEVRPRLKETTWRAFELAVLQGMSTDQVSEVLGLSAGQVYVYKSRVLKRLAEAVEAMDA